MQGPTWPDPMSLWDPTSGRGTELAGWCWPLGLKCHSATGRPVQAPMGGGDYYICAAKIMQYEIFSGGVIRFCIRAGTIRHRRLR